MATTGLLQQYPALANDPQFAQGYQQLEQLARAPLTSRLTSQHVQQTQALLEQLTARARSLGLPSDRRINAAGGDESIHTARNEALKGLALGGLSLLGGGLANAALAGGGAAAAGTGGTIAATSSPIASTTASTALPAAVSGLGGAGGTAATIAAPAGSAAGTIGTIAKVGSSVPYGKIIDAGVGLANTYFQNRAQGKAIDAQTAANQQAQADQKAAQQQQIARIDRNQQTQQALFSPYTNLGAGAASTLASRLGLPTGPAPGTQPLPITSSAPGLQPGMLMPPTANQPAPAPGSLHGQGGTLAQLVPAAQQQQAQNQTQSGYVTMQSPDGEVAQVAPHQVEFYRSRGAQVLQVGA